jgi:hypothetical protein
VSGNFYLTCLTLEKAPGHTEATQRRAQQHYRCTTVRNLIGGKVPHNLLYLFEVTDQCDRFDRLVISRDNAYPCEITILAKASEGKSLWGVVLIILYYDGHRPVRRSVGANNASQPHVDIHTTGERRYGQRILKRSGPPVD